MGSDATQVDADIGREIFERRQVSEINEFVDGKTFNHGSENVAKSNAANALRSGSDAEQKGLGKSVKNFFIGVGQNMMSLVADEKIGSRYRVKTPSQSLNAGNLNGQGQIHIFT